MCREVPDLSERRASEVLGQPRSTQRYACTKADTDKPLVAAMHELAKKHPRYGYRRIHVILEQDGFKAGRDRVHRLWRLHVLKVPRRTVRRRRLGNAANGITRHEATGIDQVWTYDFVKDQTLDGRSLKILTVVDEHTRESLAVEVERSITPGAVVRVLERLCRDRGRPGHIRSDNGPEFIAHAVRNWLERNKVGALYIEPGSPWQNCEGESFNGKLRDECLNLELFTSLKEAKVVIWDYREHYNQRRPHSSLDYRTPATLATACRRATALRLAALASAPSPDGTREEVRVDSVPLI